ncbi:hypothetical protein B2A_15129, partial [mine drainage metagenome]
TLSATTTGGVGPLAYSYLGLPDGCNSVDSPTVDCLGTPPGTYSATVVITDALGVSVRASTTWVVAPPLRVSIQASPPPYVLGQPVTFTATLAGGTSPYSVAWNGYPGSLNQSGYNAT